jgi:hypothetical protein
MASLLRNHNYYSKITVKTLLFFPRLNTSSVEQSTMREGGQACPSLQAPLSEERLCLPVVRVVEIARCPEIPVEENDRENSL